MVSVSTVDCVAEEDSSFACGLLAVQETMITAQRSVTAPSAISKIERCFFIFFDNPFFCVFCVVVPVASPKKIIARRAFAVNGISSGTSDMIRESVTRSRLLRPTLTRNATEKFSTNFLKIINKQ